MKAAGSTILAGAGAGIAASRGVPGWAIAAGAILGAASPFGESLANYLAGIGVNSGAFQSCMASAGIFTPGT
jgi:hypothetical protein